MTSITLFAAGCNSGGGGGCVMAGNSCGTVACCTGLTCGAGNICVTNTGCSMNGQACGTGCCAGLTCSNNMCVGGGCSTQGQACGNGCCNGLTCTNNTCQMNVQCGTSGQPCTNGCCMGLTCMNSTCQGTDTRLNFGEAPCTSPADCKTNLCAGFTSISSQEFCTAGCTKSTDCAALSTKPYWCVVAAMGDLCLRGCSSNTECTDLGTDWSCDVYPNTESMLTGMCGVFKNLNEGAPCTAAGQCAGGTCNGAWCAKACFATTDCTGNGATAACLLTQGANQACFPTCTSNNDCAQFNVLSGVTTTCKAATDVGGASVMICSG